MKPFRRTGFNVPLHCPLPKCRARGSWGTFPHACFSCFVLFASSKENEVAPAKPASQFMIREEKVETRSGRAGPSFSVRPEKEAKGAVCTALRQRQNEATIEPVRRTFPNSTIHIVSNTWEGSFLPYGQKSPHEPRSEQSVMLPRPPDSAQRRIKMPVSKAIRNHTFLCTFFFS